MKGTLVIMAIMLGLTANSQSIPIQLMVVDQNGFEMPNTQVKLRLTMRGDTSLTTGQYQEVHNVSTNDLGVVSVDLGEGIVTTNSQVLAIDLFSFGLDEPYIKTELDTSISPANYTNLGWMRYRYPLVARRALMADSANFSDSASFLINADNDWYKDSSELNEIQNLVLSDLGYLKLSKSNDSVLIRTEFSGTSNLCFESGRVFYSDSSVQDVVQFGDTTIVLKELSSTADSILRELIFYTSTGQTSIQISTGSSITSPKIFIRPNRVVLYELQNSLLVFDFQGSLLSNTSLGQTKLFIGLGDSVAFFTNRLYNGTNFTLTSQNIFTGQGNSTGYISECSGCVSRPLPNLANIRGDTLWVTNVYGNSRYMMIGSNFYESNSNSYVSKGIVKKIVMGSTEFKLDHGGALMISNSISTSSYSLSKSGQYFTFGRFALNGPSFNIFRKGNRVYARYKADGPHLLTGGVYVNTPSGLNTMVDLSFDINGELIGVNTYLASELRSDLINGSSVIRMTQGDCLNGQNISASLYCE
jgi:hypothetical protein